ncbi:MAG: hypothetical protein AVDCRST_MAG07-2889, partial [uncultured Frankineae bacterium]
GRGAHRGRALRRRAGPALARHRPAGAGGGGRGPAARADERPAGGRRRPAQRGRGRRAGGPRPRAPREDRARRAGHALVGAELPGAARALGGRTALDRRCTGARTSSGRDGRL